MVTEAGRWLQILKLQDISQKLRDKLKDISSHVQNKAVLLLLFAAFLCLSKDCKKIYIFWQMFQYLNNTIKIPKVLIFKEMKN